MLLISSTRGKVLLLQTQGGETVGLLGATEGARFGHTHPILSSPSPLAPWALDFSLLAFLVPTPFVKNGH